MKILKIFLILILFLSFPTFSEAGIIDSLREKIGSKNSQIEEIQEEIDEYEAELVEIGEEKQTLQSAIKTLDVTRNRLGADIRQTQSRIDNESLNIEKLNLDITDKENKIKQNDAAISETIRRVNEADGISLIEGVLASQDLSDFWTDFESIESFQVGIKEDLEKLRTVKTALSNDKVEVEARRGNLVSERSQLSDKKSIVDQNKREKDTLLKTTKNKESNYEALLEEKQREKEKFERELFEFESQLQFQLDPSKIPSIGSGVLAWPLEVIRITQRFGRTSSSGRLYASGTHNGVDFGISSGNNVKASLTGIVEGVGNTDQYYGCLSYGKWVLIKHNNGLSTLYAHLSLTTVSLGQNVSTGQVIGYSGNTGYSTGPHLHLTLFASQGVRITRLGDIPGRAITKCSNASIPIAPPDAYLDPLDYL
jgi:murein DD-endopeptidase MepM/ murein hydrolase activator NlpD